MADVETQQEGINSLPQGKEGAEVQAGAAPSAVAETGRYEHEIEQLRAQLAEKDEAVRYWHEQAKGKGHSEAGNQVQQEEEKSEDLLDLIGKKGSKGLKDWLARQGFVSREEVDRRVEARARQIAKEAEVQTRYPDLKDVNSEFFKATAKEYGRLRGSVPDELALELAAERAELASLRSKASARTADKEGREEERQARARAQQGDTGRRSSKQSEEVEDGLTPEQLAICESMGIDPEAYKKRAKAGVQYMGKTR